MESAFIITKRGTAEHILETARENGALGGIVLLGRGTAKSSVIEMLGLGKGREYELIMTQIPKDNLPLAMDSLAKEMKVEKPGRGILFTIPLRGASGFSILKHAAEDRGARKSANGNKEAGKVNDSEFSAIVSIVKRGFADETMEAARGAGAGGGFVLHARSGLDPQKFMGITIEDERDVLINVVEKDKAGGILAAIVEKAGVKTEAQGMSMVLPVSCVRGLAGVNGGHV